MSVFRYKTYDTSGKVVSGIIDADSSEQASLRLKNKGLYPFEIAEESAKNKEGQQRHRLKRVSSAERTAFTRQTASLLASGMPLLDCLTAIAEQAENTYFNKVCAGIREAIAGGAPFAEALSKHPAIFSATYVHLVHAGEASGNLDEIMEELAGLGEKQEAMRGKLMATLAYPVLMTIIGISVLFILFALVIPKIITIFDTMGQSLPLPTRILIFASETASTGWPLILIILSATTIAAYRFYKSLRGREVIDRVTLKIPLVGRLISRVEISRFARTLSVLLKGGVPITEAIEITGDVISNLSIAKAVNDAGRNIREGGDLHSSLKATGLFPPVALHMIGTGEKGGRLEEMLFNLAETYDREVESATAALASMVEPILIVVMGLIVGFIALAIMLPIFDMNMMVG